MSVTRSSWKNPTRFLCTLLRWSHSEKIDRLCRLIGVLRMNSIETEPELAEWLHLGHAAEALLAIKGIGPKTVDYLKILVGIPTVAVDRHVRMLFRIVGLECSDYQDLRAIICHAADLLELQPHILDAIIWQYFSTEHRSISKERSCV